MVLWAGTMDEAQATKHSPDAPGPMQTALDRWWTVQGDLALAAYRAITRTGLALPTQRALAAESQMSTSAVSRHTGGELPSMLAAAMAQVRQRSWPRRLRSARDVLPLYEWLPETDGEVRDARVWLAWLELARGHAEVAPAIGDVGRSEREALAVCARASGLPDDPEVLVAVECVLAGLVVRRCDPVDPLGYADAVAALGRVVQSLRGGGAGAAA